MKNFTSIVYVVTRAGRRIEPENYAVRKSAVDRAARLRMILKEWNDPDVSKVEVVSSSTPHKIR